MDSESFFRNNYSTHFDNNSDRACYAVDCYDAMDKFAVAFSEWLIKKCDFQKHGVWLYKGMEMTQKELLDVFNHDIE